MSTNCLVTKLKGTVDNNNLPELGTIKIPVKATENVIGMTNLGGWEEADYTPHDVVVSIEDGNLYTYSGSTPVQTTNPANWHNGSQKGVKANTNCIMRIKDYYNLAYFKMNVLFNNGGVVTSRFANDFVFDLNQFKYCDHITFVGGYLDYQGDIVEAFGHLKEFGTMVFNCGKITGDLKTLVGKWISNGGETTGSFNFGSAPYPSNNFKPDDLNITLNGTKMSVGEGTTQKPTKVKWQSATKVYVEVGGSSSTIYATGYTTEEIATNTASGGIWEGKTVTSV